MKMIGIKELCFRLGISRATVYRWVASEILPSPKKLSGYRTGRIAWAESTINAWIEARPSATLHELLPD